MLELISYGGKGTSHWGQVQCRNCGAWLKEMPDRFEKHNAKNEETHKYIYHYFWQCLSCGEERKIIDFASPDTYTPKPQAQLHKPGTLPPPIVRNPDKWRCAGKLSLVEKILIRECWNMLFPLFGKLTIHQVNYIWNLDAALKSQDIRAVIKTAQEYVDMLDYEKIHGKEPGSYRGVEGDVTKIRLTLQEIGSPTWKSNNPSSSGVVLKNISKKDITVGCRKNSPADEKQPGSFVPRKVQIINDAIRKDRLIRFSYTSVDGERTVRSIKPVEVKKFSDTLCISGHCYLRDASRTFAVERMEGLTIVTEKDLHK